MDANDAMKDMIASVKRLDSMIQSLCEKEKMHSVVTKDIEKITKLDEMQPATIATKTASDFFAVMENTLLKYPEGICIDLNDWKPKKVSSPQPQEQVVYRINNNVIVKSSKNQFMDKAMSILQAVDCTLTDNQAEALVNDLLERSVNFQSRLIEAGKKCFPSDSFNVQWKTGVLIANIHAEVGFHQQKWGFRMHLKVKGILRAHTKSLQGPQIHGIHSCMLHLRQDKEISFVVADNDIVTFQRMKQPQKPNAAMTTPLHTVIRKNKPRSESVQLQWYLHTLQGTSLKNIRIQHEPLLRARIIETACSSVHALFLSDMGTVYSMGKGSDGALGHGHFLDIDSPLPIEHFYEDPQNIKQIAHIAAGSDSTFSDVAHSIALTTNGQVYCWGFRMLCGAPPKQSARCDIPGLVVFPELTGTCIQIGAGNAFSLALMSTGEIYSWGKYLNGRLGLGPIPSVGRKKGTSEVLLQYQLSPLKINDIEPVAQIACGSAHAIAISSNGQLYSWGKNVHGQLGLGHCVDQFLPQPIFFQIATNSTRFKITSAACGETTSLAVDEFGQVWSWGAGTFGDRIPSSIFDYGIRSDLVSWSWVYPQKVLKLPPTIVHVVSGDRYHAALTNSGDVYSWTYDDPTPSLNQDWGHVESLSCGGISAIKIESATFLAYDLWQLWKQCKYMESLTTNPVQCDVILIVSGQKLFAHQMILASRCRSLRDRLVEEIQARHIIGTLELIIHDMRFDICRLVLEYLYTDGIYTVLDPASSIPRDLMAAATMLELPHLQQLCAPYLINPTIPKANQNHIGASIHSSQSSDFISALGSYVWSDLILVAQGEKISVHKCILIARSSYFRGLFESQLREASLPELSIDMDFSTLRRILHYVYSGEVMESNEESLADDLVAADRLGIPRLKALIESRLVVTLENCMELLVLSDMITAPILRESALTFIIDNLQVLVGAPSFLELVQQYPVLMEEIIHHPSRAKERWTWRAYQEQLLMEETTNNQKWSDEAEFPLVPIVFLIAFAMAYTYVAGELPRGASNIPLYNALILLSFFVFGVYRLKTA